MCGRYTIYTPDKLSERFSVHWERVSAKAAAARANYNAAPGQELPVVLNEGQGRQLQLMRWGLLPPWAAKQQMMGTERRRSARRTSG